MKRVCVLLQNFYEIDIRVRRKTEALIRAGYAVDVLALRSPYTSSKDYTLAGVHVYTFSLGKKRGSMVRYYFEYISFFFWSFFKLCVLTRTKKYAVIDVNNLPDFLVFAAMPGRWTGAKILFDMHEITPEFLMSKYKIGKNHWQVRLARLLERASISYADHVITINEPIQKLLESRGLVPTKSTIIMNSVDELMFSLGSGTALAESDPRPDRFVMMYHGSLTHIYGLDIAIEAFSLVHDHLRYAELWIMGNGPEKAALQKQAKTLGLEKRVRFIELVLPQEVPQWLSQCNIGILPTRGDVFLNLSFSNKLSEYIIMGKAIITSRLKTIRHYFDEEALAYFEPNSPADLAKQMARLYGDRALCGRLAKKAKDEYAPLAWSVMKARYLDLMKELTNQEASSLPTGNSSI
jgi:glycosyltransferase involved in cell wall biosynthesis